MLKFIGEFFFIISFLQSSMLMAQESDPVQIKSDTFINTFWGDFQTATSESFSPKNYRIINLVGYGTLTALLLFNFDAELHEEYGIERENTPLGLPKFLTQIGNIYDKPNPIIFTAGLTGLMYGSGRIFKNEKLIETTALMTKSFMITAMINTALKILIGRARPYVNGKSNTYRPFNFKLDADYMSMPSGHASSIFAVMTVIAKQYDHWYVAVPAYTLAGAVTFQRIDDKKHWASDLLIGSTIGYLIASALVDNSANHYFIIEPVIGTRGVGVNLHF